MYALNNCLKWRKEIEFFRVQGRGEIARGPDAPTSGLQRDPLERVQKTMSYKLVDAVFKIRLTATEKAILGALCSHANDRAPTVWVSVANIALESGASERTVQRTLRSFEERKFIRALFGKKGGKHSETVNYKMLIPNADIVAAIQSEYNDGDGPRTGDKVTPVDG